MAMSRKKIISLIAGICGMLLGIIMLVAGIMDADIPKLLRIAFSVVFMANAVLIIWINLGNKN